MTKKKKEDRSVRKIIVQNRKARHNYFIENVIEAGIVLMGSEVKSLRLGHASIDEAWAGTKEENIWLNNAYIQEYKNATYQNHDAKRPRKLLLHKRELSKLSLSLNKKGVTVIPLSIFFNIRGIVKVELGLASGKKQYDKRQTEKERDWNRQKQRFLRELG